MADIILSYERWPEGNKGALKPNERGEYRVRLGALNVFNTSGIGYIDGDGEYNLRNAIKNDGQDGRPMSMLNQRMYKNSFLGEAGHPNWEPGMDKSKFFERNLYIDPKCVSHSIRKLYLIDTKENVNKLGITGNIVYIDADIVPIGPYGQALKQMLESPYENVAFSIRALTDIIYVNSTKIRKLKDIMSWDWVIEPGIKMANKLDMIDSRLSTENHVYRQYMPQEGIAFSVRDVEQALENLKVKAGENSELSIESDLGRGIEICNKILNKPILSDLLNW